MPASHLGSLADGAARMSISERRPLQLANANVDKDKHKRRSKLPKPVALKALDFNSKERANLRRLEDEEETENFSQFVRPLDPTPERAKPMPKIDESHVKGRTMAELVNFCLSMLV